MNKKKKTPKISNYMKKTKCFLIEIVSVLFKFIADPTSFRSILRNHASARSSRAPNIQRSRHDNAWTTRRGWVKGRTVTVQSGFSDKRLATTEPAEPPPITTKSYLSLISAACRSICSRRSASSMSGRKNSMATRMSSM